MDEHEPESNSVLSADLHVCIFPNLDEFMVIDVRDLEAPKARVLPAVDVLTPNHYDDLEAEFSRLLRTEGPPFLNLMLLSAKVQAMLQERGIAALAKTFGMDAANPENNRMSLFLCSGSILSMHERDVTGALEVFFGGNLPPGFVEECNQLFKKLLAEEKSKITRKEQDELRRAVLGKSEQFYTLWQSPGSSPGSSFSNQ
jgi:hypothetical protein